MMRNPTMGEVAFFSKITASVTHELQNVLAIIQESAGLMEDLLAFSAAGADDFGGKLEKSLMVVKKQLLRGIDLTTRLNRFAHSPDQTLAQVNLCEITKQMTVLSSRFAALKKIDLINHVPDQPIQIVVNLVQLQIALFLSIECCLDVLAQDGQLTVGLEKKSSTVLIHVLCEGNLCCQGDLAGNLSGTDHWESLGQTLVNLGGTAEFDPSGNGIVLSLAIEKEK